MRFYFVECNYYDNRFSLFWDESASPAEAKKRMLGWSHYSVEYLHIPRSCLLNIWRQEELRHLSPVPGDVVQHWWDKEIIRRK